MVAQTDAFHTDQSLLCQYCPEYASIEKSQTAETSFFFVEFFVFKNLGVKHSKPFCNNIKGFFNVVLFNSNLTDEKDKNESLTFLGPVDVACMSTSHPQTPGW